MELFCGKCLVNMVSLKKADISNKKWMQVTQKMSFKCPECGHVIAATWDAEIILPSQHDK